MSHGWLGDCLLLGAPPRPTDTAVSVGCRSRPGSGSRRARSDYADRNYGEPGAIFDSLRKRANRASTSMVLDGLPAPPQTSWRAFWLGNTFGYMPPPSHTAASRI